MTFSLAAARGGSRVGIAAGAGPSGQMLLTVAPKVWRPGAPRQLMIDEWPSNHVDLTLYETDRLHIAAPDADSELLFAELLRGSRETVKDEDAPWESALLAPEVAPVRWSTAPLAEVSGALSETANLLRLFQRVNLTTAPTVDLLGRAARSPLHRPLTARHFLDEVELRAAQARRGYRRVQEHRVGVRGRVEARSLARYAATGIPELACVYDELTESTQLLGVICAALEGVAEGRGARSVLAVRGFDERSLRNDAVRLRRVFGEVRALSPPEALLLGRRLRLNRLDQPWAAALRLALILLSQHEVLAAQSRARDFQAAELSADTAKIWEWIVNAVLSETGFDTVLQQGPAQAGLNEDPWQRHPLGVTPTSNTHPDNIALKSQSVFVIDAKYKPPPDQPSRSDQYQMFAYSHLVRSHGRQVSAAALIYPGVGRTREWLRGRDLGPDPVRLFAVQLPFPQPEDLLTHRAWRSYIENATRRLRGELKFVKEETEHSQT